jgi:hypothetical protein
MLRQTGGRVRMRHDISMQFHAAFSKSRVESSRRVVRTVGRAKEKARIEHFY